MMKIEISGWPHNSDFVFALALDDLHPESAHEAEKLDFGSDPAKPPLSRLARLLEKHPQLKLTLFTVPNWIDRSDWPDGYSFFLRKFFRIRRSYPPGTFDISREKYRGWVKKINAFRKSQVEIAPHGYSHFQPDKTYGHSQEFADISYRNAHDKLRNSVFLIRKSGLRFSMGFRSSGWCFNDNLLKALKTNGFVYAACSANIKGSIDENNRILPYNNLRGQSSIKENWLAGGLINFTANCYPRQTGRAVDIAKKGGILLVHSHLARTDITLKYVDNKFRRNISRMLFELRDQIIGKPWHATLEELAKFLIARKSLKIKKLSLSTFQLSNLSNFDLNGLTVKIDNIPFIIDRIPAGKKATIKKYKNGAIKILSEGKRRTSPRGTGLFRSANPRGTGLFPGGFIKPLFSVILTVFNGEKTVIKSLESLARQSLTNTEIIVVNDGSTDSTLRLLRQYAKRTNDPRIVIVDQENRGRGAAKNAGLRIARGRYIAFCEDDAVYSSGYLQAALPHLRQPLNLGVIGPHYVLNRSDSLIALAKDLERRRNFRNYHPKTAWLYRTVDLKKIGGFDESLAHGEDIEPMVRLKKIYPNRKIVYEPECRWLHSEPADLKSFLKRKYEGGRGLAQLQKRGIRLTLSPLKIAGLFIGFLAFCLFGILFPFHAMAIAIIAALGLPFAKFSLIQLSRRISAENIFVITAGIYIEYLGKMFTLIGFLSAIIWPSGPAQGSVKAINAKTAKINYRRS